MITPYRLLLTPAATNQLLTLSNKQQKLVLKFIEALAINPRLPGAMRIEGMTGLYSQTIHHQRIIYKIEEHEVLILLVR